MKSIIVWMGLLLVGCGVGVASSEGTTGNDDESTAQIIGGACGATTQMARFDYGLSNRDYDIWSGGGLAGAPGDLSDRCHNSPLLSELKEIASTTAKQTVATKAAAMCDAFQCPSDRSCSKQCQIPEPTVGFPTADCVLLPVRWDDASQTDVIACSCSATALAHVAWDATCVDRSLVPRQITSPLQPAPLPQSDSSPLPVK
jgi:hypothetical protein